MKIKKVDDKPMVIHIKKKAKQYVKSVIIANNIFILYIFSTVNDPEKSNILSAKTYITFFRLKFVMLGKNIAYTNVIMVPKLVNNSKQMLQKSSLLLHLT